MCTDQSSLPETADDKSSIKVHLIYAAVLILTVTVFCSVIYKGERNGAFKLQLGEHQVEIDFKGDTLSVKDIVDKLFSDEEKKREACVLLKEFAELYQPTDPSVVAALEEQDKESKVAESLRKLLYELRGPFERSMHSYYDVEKTDIVAAIEVLGFNHPVSGKLRELLVYRKGPFEEQATEVLYSVPAGSNIPTGRAASCKSNKLYKQEVLVFNMQKTRSISVFVSESFPCPEGELATEMGKLLHISTADMQNLTGTPPGEVQEYGYAEIALNY